MIYHEYSRNQTSSICYVYRCSQCGTLNQGSVEVGVQTSYNDRGVWTKKGMEKRRLEAEKRSRDSLAKKKKKVIEQIERRDYRYLNLKIQCRKCSHQEKWAQPGFALPKWADWLSAILLIPIFPPVIFLTWYLIDKYTGINAYLGVGILVFAFACLAAGPHIIYRSKYRKTASEFSTIPEESLPHAFSDTNKTALFNARLYYVGNNLGTDAEFDELEKYHNYRAIEKAIEIQELLKNMKLG